MVMFFTLRCNKRSLEHTLRCIKYSPPSESLTDSRLSQMLNVCRVSVGGYMIAVIFRWDLKPGHEQTFKEGWSEIIHRNIEKYGALGSRLHHAQGNQWIAYSQWVSEEHFKQAQNLHDKHEQARIKMLTSIEKAYTPIITVPILDHLMASQPSQPQLIP